MRYCETCGTPHECTGVVGEVDKTAIELRRLETHRDIEVARLNAGAAKSIARTEADTDADHAEGVIEGMETALEAVSGGGSEPEPVGDPIVVDGGDDEPEPEPVDDVTPPVVIPEPAEPKSAGWWSGYASKR